ncbi:MAG: outer membrane lipoprotein-sorting protein [Methylococcales bacterium]|nr:outer membrane lipoprotein-sorting protein [Methylococcales bacterium]
MKLTQFVFGLSIMLASSLALAETPSVDKIIHSTNYASYYQGQDGKAKVKMTITDAQKRVRTREFTILRRDTPTTDEIKNHAYEGEQKMYVYFNRPADVNKMVFMVLKKMSGDDDRWLYLPALDLVKRIAATDKRTSFVGSDFLYEDVSGRSLLADKHVLISTDDNYYIVENTPVDASLVEFSKYIMYIHKTSFLPIQTEYFDKQGAKSKVYTALAVDTIQGHPTITKAEVKNLKTGSSTVMEYSSVKYDVGIPDEIFSERFLRKAPRKLLR